MPWRDLGFVDVAVLVAVFAFYVWRTSGGQRQKPHLVGPER